MLSKAIVLAPGFEFARPMAQRSVPVLPSSAVAMELARRPVPLRSGIGAAHDDLTTRSKQAQAFYDQGLAYLHSYVWLEAARSCVDSTIGKNATPTTN